MSTQCTKKEILRELSFQFIIDGYHFYEQGNILLKDPSLEKNTNYHIGYVAKISVLFHMSIECSLKSLICVSDIMQDPKDVYKNKILKCGHNLKKLSQKICNFKTLLSDDDLYGKIQNLTTTVSDRYSLESITCEENFLNHENIDMLIKYKKTEAKNLSDIAWKLKYKTWNIREKEFRNVRTVSEKASIEVLKILKSK